MTSYSVPHALKNFVSGETIVVRSPGRINLIGEHTDYNDGFVLPAAIDKAVYVTLEKRNDDFLSLYSVDFNETVEVHLSALKPVPGHWVTYIAGVVDQFRQAGYSLMGFTMNIYGDVPLGAGLSSSAALECAVAFAINEAFGLNLQRKEVALIAQQAEHVFAGVKCGIMDQYASLFGKKDHVLRLDCRSLDASYFPLELQDYIILLIDTNVKHSLASSEYNVRREQCEAGVYELKERYPELISLRDATVDMINSCIEDPLIAKRCSYIVEENQRVLQGCADLGRGDLLAFGEKMFGSHEGLSKKYEVSCAELDQLVVFAKKEPGIIGARMMGGGFGGCTINIIKEANADAFIEKVSIDYRKQFQKDCTAYRTSIEEGSMLL